MMEGMVGALFASLGIDPKQILGQAAAIGAAFGRIEAALGQIQANQHAVMGHLGLEVPPLSAEMEAAAAAGTAAHLAQLEAARAGQSARAMLGAS